MKLDQLIRFLMLFPTLILLMNGTPMLWAQTSQPVSSSGKEFMVPKKEVNGKLIGQENVLVKEVAVTDSGRRYRRLDVGVTGTLEGWIVKEGPRSDHFASHPEFVFTQDGNVDRRFHGILRYEASKGTAVTLIYPEAGTEWNRKLFVTVHGSFGAFSDGSLKPWNENYDPAQPWWDISPYERLMLDKGYALAKTRRNAALGTPGDYSVTLDDGEILQRRSLNIHAGILLGLIRLTENIIDAGMELNMQMRNFDVKVYDDTAVTTYYSVGTVQRPNSSTSERWNLRITGVWIKQSGEWKLVHRHESPLALRSTPPIENRFVGTWKLAAFERRGPDGERDSANPYSNGLLVYTPTGHISLQLTRENRQEFDGRASGEEAQAALYSYIAYFGTFTANEREGTITHHRQGHLIPDRVTDGMRHYRFSGNRLMLTAPPTGEGMTTALTWERIESEN